eukprot:12523698-Heterocapsa_arctica.AAC.1
MALINFCEVHFDVFIKAGTFVNNFVNMAIRIRDLIVHVFLKNLVSKLFGPGVANTLFVRL